MEEGVVYEEEGEVDYSFGAVCLSCAYIESAGTE